LIVLSGAAVAAAIWMTYDRRKLDYVRQPVS
jgi:hypothetical protein